MTDSSYAKIIAANLKRIAFDRDKTQADMAKDLRISKATISSWMTGKRLPRMDKIDLMCDYFGCKRSDIMEDHSKDRAAAKTEAVKIPVLGRVACGIPLDAIEEIIDYEEIPEAMARGGEYFALKIRGDSMEPKFSNGDVVIVRKQDDASDGDIVVALINGSDGCCKKLRKYEGSIALVSTNPKYDPMYFTDEQICNYPVKIFGVVKELRAKF